MSRRPVNFGRRIGDGIGVPLASSLHHKQRTSPLLPLILLLLGGFVLVAYFNGGSVGSGGVVGNREALNTEAGSCSLEVQHAIPFLNKAYGDSMRKVLHVGPDTCSLVSKLSEEDIEAWGIEPYDLEDVTSSCKSMIHKGIVRVADIKFPLPYRANSFSLVIVSDALDYLSTKYLNHTLPDLARVASDGLVLFSGFPGHRKAKGSEISKSDRRAKMRSSSWWIRYFVQSMLEENDEAIKKFEQAASAASYKPSCQIFHLNSYR